MFLRSLTLKGFKSFAEATTLVLEPGLTAVVGPNGSGKSNIVDAVAWVLGAQGPRTVRSSKMEDVIFAGNGRRPALGRAEVALTIDNSAGLLPIGFTEVTLTRTLFRSSGESEYAINGVPCRLLDVQELLSDTGVGRQQHVIVSQGHLDQVLDVRPEDRRLIVEEAAGILKYRRRKEKAERRLEATETHLVRLVDLLKELRRQMKPLERQAEAARRHETLAAELRAVRLYLAGRSLASLQARAEQGAREQARLAAAEATALSDLRRLDGEVAAVESQLSAVDGSGLDATAARLEALRERARGLTAVLAERARAIDAEVARVEGGEELDVVARLETDVIAMTAELASADGEAAQLAAAAATLGEAEAELGVRRRRLAEHEKVEQAVRRAAEARGELIAVQGAAERGRAELADLEEGLQAAQAAAGERGAEASEARDALAECERHEAAAASVAAAAASDLRDAQAELAAAQAAVAEAEQRRAAAAARTEALALAAGTPAPPPDVDALGPLLELLDINPGWEAAVEAALGDALAALVVESPEAAHSVLRAGAGGAVLVVPDSQPGARPGEQPAQDAWPPGGALRPRVRVDDRPASLLLDRLLVTAVAVEGGWEEAAARAWADPTLLVVTRAGDRFGPAGWRLADPSGGAGVAAALAEARRQEAAAVEGVVGAEALATESRCRADMAEQADARAKARLDECRRASAEARDAVARLDADHRASTAALASARAHVDATARRVADDERRASRLDEQLTLPLGGFERDVDRLGVDGPVDLDAERADLAWESQAVAARRAQLGAQGEAVARRQADLRRRLDEAEARIREARALRSATEDRVSTRRRELVWIRRLTESTASARRTIDEHHADVGARRQKRTAVTRSLAVRVADGRARRSAAEHQLEELRAQGRRVEFDEAETRLRLEAAVESLRHDLDCEPETAIAAECPPMPDGASPSTRARDVERELRLLGPVNPLALEELAALEERNEFLTAQLEDVKTTRRDLARVIRSVEVEMTTLLTAAYADVAEHFTSLFETLFPGGEGRLRLTDPEHILESGIEIEARPGGKSARKLSLLSGGERSLTALAFLFAVFRSRPSPFYLLDEVEAALDDVNLHRFLRLLDDFRNEAQLLVVTHQKRTMESADCLFGVTMQPGGSSKVLSERVRVAG